MFRSIRRNAFKAQACFCAALMLFTQFYVAGCGPGGFSLFPTGMFYIPLGPSDALVQSLANSTFHGPSGIEVTPGTRRFRLVYSDARQFKGGYDLTGSSVSLTDLSFFNSKGEGATLRFNNARQVASITLSDGKSWARPAGDNDRAAVLDGVAGLDDSNPYIAANRDIIELAAALEQAAQDGVQPAAPGDPSSPAGDGGSQAPKGATASASGTLANILKVLAIIWLPIASIIQPIAQLFSVAFVLDNALGLRYDGTWTAVNSTSNLIVTIAGGKIVRLVDDASRQELDIVNTRLADRSGNRVTWVVNAQVLGQSTTVEFTFDVEELTNGSLEGTLTALGSTFARVPVTMTRT